MKNLAGGSLQRLPRTFATAGMFALLTTAYATSAFGQASPRNAAISLRVGTLGFSAEISKLLASHLAARVGGNFVNYDRSQSISDVDYNAALNFKSLTALLDLYPRGLGSFHFTGGLIFRQDAVTATGVAGADGSFSFGETAYSQAEVGLLTGELTFPKTSPYVGIGWGTPARKGSAVRLVFDLGAVIGVPTVALNSTNASSNPQLAASLQAQEEKTQSDIDRYVRVWPVVSIGLAYHF